MTDTATPTARPAEIAAHPKLNIVYRTDPDRIAPLLPPGIEPTGSPNVYLGIYCVPVRNEPEYGVSTKVAAMDYGLEGMAGTHLSAVERSLRSLRSAAGDF